MAVWAFSRNRMPIPLKDQMLLSGEYVVQLWTTTYVTS